MDYKYIEQLADRYFEGLTTLHEEQILKTFFAQTTDDMPAELRQYAPLFQALQQPADVLGDDFDQHIMALTRQADDADASAKPVQARVLPLSERLRPLFRAAAVVAILLTLGNAINQSFKQADTWVDADEYARRQAPVPEQLEPAVAYEQPSDSASRVQADEPAMRVVVRETE